jgi:hypothetical protein
VFSRVSNSRSEKFLMLAIGDCDFSEQSTRAGPVNWDKLRKPHAGCYNLLAIYTRFGNVFVAVPSFQHVQTRTDCSGNMAR